MPSLAPSPAPSGGAARIALVVSNLEYGGAQRQVVALANQINASGGDATVVSLSDYVPLATALADSRRTALVVRKRHRFDVTVVARLALLLRRRRIDLAHAFLNDAELATRLVRAVYPRLVVVGSERNADYRPRLRHTVPLRLTQRWCDAIIANSHAGKRFRERVFGASPASVFVVPNGVDTARFTPGDGGAVRSRLGISLSAPVVAMFASFKQQKNHPMFFRVARAVSERCSDARFLCVGGPLHGGLEGSDDYEQRMKRLAVELGVADRIHFAGNQDDVVPWFRAADVTVLTSAREGTPNVLLESMACGIPVVATNVADNARVVPDGRVGFIVPYDDHDAMAARVIAFLCDPAARLALAGAARDWVDREFSVARLAERTTAVYGELLARRRLAR